MDGWGQNNNVNMKKSRWGIDVKACNAIKHKVEMLNGKILWGKFPLFSFCRMNLEICENMHEGGRNILVEDEEKDFMRMTFYIFIQSSKVMQSWLQSFFSTTIKNFFRIEKMKKWAMVRACENDMQELRNFSKLFNYFCIFFY